MNSSLPNLDQQRLLDILRAVWEGNHQFKDVHDELGWSKATVSKYLQSLQDTSILHKDLTSEEKIGYFFTEEGKKWFENQNIAKSMSLSLSKDSLIEHQKKTNRLVDDLESKGLFSNEGLDENDMVELLREHSDLATEKVHEATAENIRKFYLMLMTDLEPKIWDKNVKASLSIESDPKELKADLEGLEESINKIGWPEED